MNARLRTALFSGLLTLGAFSTITYSSCTEDKCKAVVCANTGVCNQGSCVCPTGYEGPQCEITNRDRFIGIWQVTEDGTLSAAAQYPVAVEKGDAINKVNIKNFRNSLIERVPAVVKGDTITLIANDYNGYHVDGHGYLTDDKYYGDHGKLVMFYSVKPLSGDSTDYYGLGDRGDASLWNK